MWATEACRSDNNIDILWILSYSRISIYATIGYETCIWAQPLSIQPASTKPKKVSMSGANEASEVLDVTAALSISDAIYSI